MEANAVTVKQSPFPPLHFNLPVVAFQKWKIEDYAVTKIFEKQTLQGRKGFICRSTYIFYKKKQN